VSQGIAQVTELQRYVKAEVTSMSGMVFFLAWFLLVLFATSFKKYQASRNQLVTILTVEIAVELLAPSVLTSLIGLRPLRIICVIIMVMCLISNGSGEGQLEKAMAGVLNTPRLERVFRKAAEEQGLVWAKQAGLSSRWLSPLRRV
jgi:hypothetical protein